MVFPISFFPVSGFLDTRKLFPGTFQDFNFDILKSCHFYRISNISTIILLEIYFFAVSSVSQQGASVSQLPAALRRPQNNTPRDFWSRYLVDLGDGTAGNQLCRHQTKLKQREISCSITSQNHFQKLPAGCVCVAAACGASATSEKHAPGFLEQVSCGSW